MKYVQYPLHSKTENILASRLPKPLRIRVNCKQPERKHQGKETQRMSNTWCLSNPYSQSLLRTANALWFPTSDWVKLKCSSLSKCVAVGFLPFPITMNLGWTFWWMPYFFLRTAFPLTHLSDSVTGQSVLDWCSSGRQNQASKAGEFVILHIWGFNSSL